MRRSVRRPTLLLIDLGLIAIATLLALVVRDNLEFSLTRVEALLPYLALTLAIATLVLIVSGPAAVDLALQRHGRLRAGAGLRDRDRAGVGGRRLSGQPPRRRRARASAHPGPADGVSAGRRARVHAHAPCVAEEDTPAADAGDAARRPLARDRAGRRHQCAHRPVPARRRRVRARAHAHRRHRGAQRAPQRPAAAAAPHPRRARGDRQPSSRRSTCTG